MGIKVETFRIHYLIRTPKVLKLSLQPKREVSTQAQGEPGPERAAAWKVAFRCVLEFKGLGFRDV